MSHYIKNFDKLAVSRERRHALEILEAGLEAAAPEKAVARALRSITITGDVHVLGFGKASHRMLKGVLGVVKPVGGVIITNDERAAGVIDGVEVLVGDHPLPGERSLRATERLLEYAEGISRDDTVIVLVSGGGSALFEKPVPPIEIGELAETTKMLMDSGADIYELNTVRKHLSLVKGGRLAALLKAARIVSLIISDVVGDRLDMIASGPTVPDPTTYNDAIRVLRRRELWGRVPESVRRVLVDGASGLIPETPKPGDPLFNRVLNVLAASNKQSLEAMMRAAEERGYTPLILSSMVTGEAREVGRFIAGIAAHAALYGIAPLGRRLAVLMGGETTVTVHGNGVGGRNQELALSFLCSLDERARGATLLAAMGSDGIDGVSPAAGAVADEATWQRALSMGLDCRDYLERNDSYTFFSRIGDAIYTGPTGTNVNDFIVLLVYASS
ncbi:MAG: glycerate kinase [Crenarchaeota archaeon]|nr:glycerate kinase [Thermoproteota archaeon]